MSNSEANESYVSEGQIFLEGDLFEKMLPLLKAHNKGEDELYTAIKQANEAMRLGFWGTSLQEMQSVLLQITLANLFARREPLWIHTRTESGNNVPAEILIEAYSLWGKARKIAREWGVDSAAAADAMAKATHSVVDQRANNKENQETIRDVRKYIFASFRHETYVVALKQGIHKTIHIDSLYAARTRCFSDQGKHAHIMDCSILYQEFLNSLDRDTKIIAHARLSLEYGWDETSEQAKMSAKTAHNRLNKAIREGLGLCMRELQFKGCNKSSTGRTG
jgi:hypothetical protein